MIRLQTVYIHNAQRLQKQSKFSDFSVGIFEEVVPIFQHFGPFFWRFLPPNFCKNCPDHLKFSPQKDPGRNNNVCKNENPQAVFQELAGL